MARILHQLICSFTLAVAGLGASPLWIHQATHHCAHSSVADETQHDHGCGCQPADSTCADTPMAEGQERTDGLIEPGISAAEDNHECFVCFNLSQTNCDGWVVQGVSGGTHVVEFNQPCHSISISNLSCPAPARGPPAA